MELRQTNITMIMLKIFSCYFCFVFLTGYFVTVQQHKNGYSFQTRLAFESFQVPSELHTTTMTGKSKFEFIFQGIACLSS